LRRSVWPALRYGILRVKGTEQDIEHLHTIGSPLGQRNAIMARQGSPTTNGWT
jgi:hypothetical protein